MKKALTLFAITSLSLLLSGCITVDPNNPEAVRKAQIERLALLARDAAQLGTRAYLFYNPSPERREQFAVALSVLKELQATKNFDPIAFAIALENLPVKELKSPEAILSIDAAAILFDQVMSTRTSIEKPEVVEKVLAAVIIGIERGMPPPAWIPEGGYTDKEEPEE